MRPSNFIESPSSLVQDVVATCTGGCTCCSPCRTLAARCARNKNIRLVKIEFWTAIKNLQFWMGPKLYRVTFFFGSRCFTTCNGRLHAVRMELLRKMPRKNIRLDRVLSDSGQHCVDLSPIKNYKFGWGPNFIESPSSLVQICSDVLRLATEDYMLFGWNSCARCLTRTLVPIEFFLTQVNSV